jgi:hypothetical protein
MPTKEQIRRSEAAQKAIRTRRRINPGGSADRLDSALVLKTFGRRKTFSTGEVMKEFDASIDNATAVMAVLSARKKVEKSGQAPDGTSLWQVK